MFLLWMFMWMFLCVLTIHAHFSILFMIWYDYWWGFFLLVTKACFGTFKNAQKSQKSSDFTSWMITHFLIMDEKGCPDTLKWPVKNRGISQCLWDFVCLFINERMKTNTFPPTISLLKQPMGVSDKNTCAFEWKRFLQVFCKQAHKQKSTIRKLHNIDKSCSVWENVGTSKNIYSQIQEW